MAVTLYILFLAAYTILVSMFGQHIKWMNAHPNYFIPLFLFMIGHNQYQHRLLFTLSTGLAADLFGSEQWAMHATFFVLLHILLQKIFLDRFIHKMYVYIPITFLCALLYQFMVLVIDSTPVNSKTFIAYSVLTTGLTLILFPLFKLIRLGWGTQGGQQSMPVLNG